MDEDKANAARYELLRDMQIYDMQLRGTIPVPLDEAYEWFDAMVDTKIRERYPNAPIGD